MSFNASKWAWDQDLKPSAKFVLLALADCLNERTGRLNPSISAISEKTGQNRKTIIASLSINGQNRKTIIASLSILEGLGLIVKAKSHGTSTSYKLNLDVLCSAENGTGTHEADSPKNGTTLVPKTVLDQSQKGDTNQEEPRKNQELLGDKPLKQKTKKFVKPTIDELENYKKENQFISDPQAFFDYHKSAGWVIGKSLKPMKDWKAAFRTWEANKTKWDGEKKARKNDSIKNGPSIEEKLTDRGWANEGFGSDAPVVDERVLEGNFIN